MISPYPLTGYYDSFERCQSFVFPELNDEATKGPPPVISRTEIEECGETLEESGHCQELSDSAASRDSMYVFDNLPTSDELDKSKSNSCRSKSGLEHQHHQYDTIGDESGHEYSEDFRETRPKRNTENVDHSGSRQSKKEERRGENEKGRSHKKYSNGDEKSRRRSLRRELSSDNASLHLRSSQCREHSDRKHHKHRSRNQSRSEDVDKKSRHRHSDRHRRSFHSSNRKITEETEPQRSPHDRQYLTNEESATRSKANLMSLAQQSGYFENEPSHVPDRFDNPVDQIDNDNPYQYYDSKSKKDLRREKKRLKHPLLTRTDGTNFLYDGPQSEPCSSRSSELPRPSTALVPVSESGRRDSVSFTFIINVCTEIRGLEDVDLKFVSSC